MNDYIRIEEILKRQGIRFTDLANGINVAPENLYISLNNNPTLSTLKKVAEYLEVDIFELFKIMKSVTGIIFIIDNKIIIKKPFNDILELKKIIKLIEKSHINIYENINSLYERLLEILEKKEIELDYFIEVLGYTKQNLINSLTNNPSFNKLEKISKSLDIDIRELFTRKELFINGVISINGSVSNIFSYNDVGRIKKIINDMGKNKIKEERINELIEEVLSDYKDIEVDSPEITMNQIDFNEISVYDAKTTNCWSFRKKGDTRKGKILNFSNMLKGFEIEVLGKRFHDSECAYISGCYSLKGDNYLKIQEELANYSNGGYNAKRVYRKTKNEVTNLIRGDWEFFNFQWMLLILWEKCKSNPEFKNMLLSIPSNAMIIEDTSHFPNGRNTSLIWGAKNPELTALRKKKKSQIRERLILEGVTVVKTIALAEQKVDNMINTIGVWTGQNATGKALKLCQLALLQNTVPPIDYELLNKSNIYWFGEKLEFDVNNNILRSCILQDIQQ